LAAGKITAKELPIATGERQRTDKIRVAPGFGVEQSSAGGILSRGTYTADGLAKFLGEVKDNGHATDAFFATFGALELIDGNSLKENDVVGLELWKIDAVVPCRRVMHNEAGSGQGARGGSFWHRYLSQSFAGVTFPAAHCAVCNCFRIESSKIKFTLWKVFASFSGLLV
jgi:hypothetical protein